MNFGLYEENDEKKILKAERKVALTCSNFITEAHKRIFILFIAPPSIQRVRRAAGHLEVQSGEA